MCSRDDQLYPLAHQLIMLLDYHPRNFTKPATYLEFNTCRAIVARGIPGFLALDVVPISSTGKSNSDIDQNKISTFMTGNTPQSIQARRLHANVFLALIRYQKYLGPHLPYVYVGGVTATNVWNIMINEGLVVIQQGLSLIHI